MGFYDKINSKIIDKWREAASYFDTYPIRMEGLVAFCLPVEDLVDSNDVVITSGSFTNFTLSTFSFPYTSDMIAVDTALGGGVLFSGITPIERTWVDWMGLAEVNVDYLWIGQNGVAAYTEDVSYYEDDIIRVLHCYISSISGGWLDEFGEVFIDESGDYWI